MTKSPFTVDGLTDGHQDGARDAARMAEDPPRAPIGMDPLKAWSWRYIKGYDEALKAGSGQGMGKDYRAEELAKIEKIRKEATKSALGNFKKGDGKLADNSSS